MSRVLERGVYRKMSERRCTRCGKKMREWEAWGTGGRWDREYVDIQIEPVRSTKIGRLIDGKLVKKQYVERDKLCRACTESYMRWFEDGKMCEMRQGVRFKSKRFNV